MHHAPGLPARNLLPGELHVSRVPTLLKTILGSCVSVTLWSARTGAAAMCHGILPTWRENYGPCNSLAEQHRYVDLSILYMLRQLDSFGVARSDLEVKLFGGADMLPIIASRADVTSVGASNCDMALDILGRVGLRVIASDLRGIRGRKIELDTSTGEVIVQRLAPYAPIDPSNGAGKAAAQITRSL